MTDWDSPGKPRKPRKPRIVGIGAQKAGTTWLSEILSQHPQVWAPPFKEVQFFNHRFVPEHRKWLGWHYRRARENIQRRFQQRGQDMPQGMQAYLERVTTPPMFTDDWYRQVFAPAPPGSRPLDITPEYSTLPEEGVDFIQDFLPQARFIYILRHPVDRAVSQLKMNLRRGGRKPATLEQWMAEIEDPVLLDRGDYATYLPRWQKRFGPERLMVIPFGRIARDPETLIREIEAFLGLQRADYKGLHQKVFASPEGLSLPPEARAALRRKLEPQFAYLAANLPPAFMADTR